MRAARLVPVSLAVAVIAALTLFPGVPVSAAMSPATPGNFTGKGFDACQAPAQHTMDVWRASSPYDALGIYISGNSRFCRDQTNLNPTWVSTQLAHGWHLLPITLGPQASCNPRFPRYSEHTDPTIKASSAYTYAAARAQGQAEASKTVSAAKSLGIVPGSTMFYDLEAFDLGNTSCRMSALWFLSSWTNQLHRLGYLSGVYSSASSGIVMLDQARTNPPANYVGPDQIWIANWNGQANTSSTGYLSNTGWADHQRVKQYKGGHNETHGGVRINIDNDYLDLRQRAVPAPIADPADPPPPTSGGGSFSMGDPRCSSRSISKPAYRYTSATTNRSLIVPLQRLLKQQSLYRIGVTGSWNSQTTQALHAFQARVHHSRHGYASRRDWVSLTTAGASNRTLRLGANGADVVMLQRALNAAGSPRLPVTGHLGYRTRRALVSYQHAVLHNSTGAVGPATWSALHAGRW